MLLLKIYVLDILAQFKPEVVANLLGLFPGLCSLPCELRSVRWADCTFEEIAAAERVVGILPVGATEAHGPHLPLDTDVIIAEAMASEAARLARAAGYAALVLPSLAYTPAPFARNFPGTISLKPETLQTLVEEIGHQLPALAIANAHLDPANLQALEAAAQSLRTAGRKVAFPNLVRGKLARRLTEEFQSGACHAGQYESSLVLAHRPEAVRTEVASGLPANPHSLVTAIQSGCRTFEEAGGPRAYFGAPSRASAAEGRASTAELGQILWEAIQDAFAR